MYAKRAIEDLKRMNVVSSGREILKQPLFRRWGWLIYLALITLILVLMFKDWGYDDPFITYRYAANLARGAGLVYNPGDRVLSTTTLLWAFMLAPVAVLKLDVPFMAVLLGAVCLGVGGLCLWELGRSARQPWLGWAGLLLFPFHPLVVTTLGSETPLYLALVLGTLALAGRASLRWAALLAGFAALARPDGLLAALVLAGIGVLYACRWRSGRDGSELIQPGKQPASLPAAWQAVLIYLLVVLPVWGWSWLYYGSPVPVTLAAKQHQGLMAISDSFLTGFWKVIKQYWSTPYFRSEIVLVGLGFLYWGWLLASGAPGWFTKKTARINPSLISSAASLLPLFVWTAAYFSAYVVLGVSRYFWYYAPLAPGAVILVGMGFTGLAQFFRKLASKLPGSGQILAPAAIACGLLLLSFSQLWGVARLQVDPRMEVYRQVGQWLAENTDRQVSVGMLEVGIIGYYADRHVIDFAGLIQPEIAARLTRESTYEDTAFWGISRYQPEIIVLHAGLFPALEAELRENALCQEKKRFPGLQLELVVYSCER